MIELQIKGAETVQAKFSALPQTLLFAVYRKYMAIAIQMVTHIKRNKLSGQVLNVKTGDLRDSITQDVQLRSDSVVATVFSAGNIPYAPVHEYGGKSYYEILPINAKALAFKMNGKQVFAKRVNHPPAKERSYMRSSLSDFAPAIVQGAQDAVKEAWAE